MSGLRRSNAARREFGSMYNAIIKNRRQTGFKADDLIDFLLVHSSRVPFVSFSWL